MSQEFSKWVSIWGNAVSVSENRPESYAKNITLRYPVYCPFDGSRLQLTFDNYCGTEPITINRAVILYQGHFYALTFGQKESVTIKAGEHIVSDEVSIDVCAHDTLYVSFYLAEFTLMRSSVYVSGPLSGGQYAIGDQTEVAEFPIDICKKTNIYYFLSNVSLYTHKDNRAVVCYGDSITAQAWPDYLSLRCQHDELSHTAIIRRATSGSRILREYHNITYESYGLMGTHRFDHEVPTVGADTVIIQQGINDIIHPVGTDVNPFRPMSDLPTATQLIDGLKWYIDKARSYGYRVYIGTLLPIRGWRTYAPFREDLKNEFNEFIRTTDLIDGCIDFDLATRDTADPAAFLQRYDSGDHLHPSALGYQAMADAVPIQILT